MNTDNAQPTHPTQNTQDTIDKIIDRTMKMVEDNLIQLTGDMRLMQAMEFIGVMMDIRERQQAYVRSTSKPAQACVKKAQTK